MPLYEYLCSKCGKTFERIQKFSDPPHDKCPKCGGAVHKVITAPAFQFKGSGWYITDYAKKSGGNESSDKSGGKRSETSAGKTDKAEPSAKTDTAPAKPDTTS